MSRIQDPRANDIISQLRFNENLRDEVVEWIIKHEYEKKYMKCILRLSSECKGIFIRGTYRGKRCNKCYNEYQKMNRRKNALKD